MFLALTPIYHASFTTHEAWATFTSHMSFHRPDVHMHRNFGFLPHGKTQQAHLSQALGLHPRIMGLLSRSLSSAEGVWVPCRPCHSSWCHTGHATAPGAIQAMPELLSLPGHLGATLGPSASAPWAMRQLGLSSHAPRHGQTALKNKWRKEWKFRLLSKRKQQKNPKLTNNYNILTAVLGLLWSCLCFALGRGEWVLQQGPHRKSGSPEGHPQLSLCPCFAQPQLLQAPTTLLPSGLWQDHPLQGITCIFYILIKTAEF